MILYIVIFFNKRRDTHTLYVVLTNTYLILHVTNILGLTFGKIKTLFQVYR